MFKMYSTVNFDVIISFTYSYSMSKANIYPATKFDLFASILYVISSFLLFRCLPLELIEPPPEKSLIIFA